MQGVISVSDCASRVSNSGLGLKGLLYIADKMQELPLLPKPKLLVSGTMPELVHTEAEVI